MVKIAKEFYMNYILLLGRALFSSIFLIKATHHFSGPAMDHAIARGVPSASILVPLMGIVCLIGGLSILLGYKAKKGAWLLFLFLLPTTFMMHPVWTNLDPYARMMEEFCFLKNFSLMGAALIVAYFGSGPLSLDNNKS